MGAGTRTESRDREELLAELIGDIYSAPLEPHRWPEIIQRILEAVHRAAPSSPEVAAATLAEVYRLTPAEARLLRIIATGRSLKQAASSLDISVNTAHTQLSSIFAKTGTRRQTQLITLMFTLPRA